MRVISGKYKGRNLLGFNIDGTRPTMDRIKESMFAMVQDKIKGSCVLDLFAGSGSLGIEALSNGAKECIFVDNNNIAISIIKNNLQNLKANERYEVIKSEYNKALVSFKQKNMKFDLILLDPPYDNDYIENILDLLYEYDLLSIDGYIICEYEKDLINANFNIYKTKDYGSKKITIFSNK